MTDSTNFKDYSKAPSLPLFSKRPDVRLLNTRIWPLPSEVGCGLIKGLKHFNNNPVK